MTTFVNNAPSALRLSPSAGDGTTILSIDPLTDPLWQRLLERHSSSVFHSPAWIRVLVETYSLDIRAAVAVDRRGEPQAGIPYGRVSDILGDRIVTLPFSDYCDPLVTTAHEWNSLIEGPMSTHCPVVVRCLHNSLPLADERFSTVKQAKWHGLDLRPDLETLFRGFDDSARRAIKKAQREGVTVRIADSLEDLRAFFRLHSGIRKRKYRLLAQPYQFFENLWRHLVEQGKGFLMIAVHEKEILGGVMFLEWRDTLYYKFNASSPAHLNYRPNDRVIWEGIQLAKEKGYRFLDFGLSDWDQEELIRYKRKYASEEKTISFLRHEPTADPTPQEKELRALLGKVTSLFVDDSVPDTVTEAAGDLLYRYFV